MHSGRASKRVGGVCAVGGALLAVWIPRHVGEPLPLSWRIGLTALAGVVAVYLVASALVIDRRAKAALARRRSGDPRKRVRRP